LAKITKKQSIKRSRPVGIAILAILEILGGILVILFGALSGTILSSIATAPNMAMLGPVAGVIGIAFVILGVIALVNGYGLWTGMKWAWWLTVVIAVISVIVNLLSLVHANFGALGGIIVEAIILYYMTRPNVKAYFGVK